MKKRPAKIHKEKMMKIVEGFFMHFDDEDSDSATVEGLHGYLRMLIGQDNKRIVSFLENRKIIKITEFKSVGHHREFVGVRIDALVNRAKLTALKKDIESSTDKFIEIGTMLVWGKKGSRRRSRLH